MFLGTLGHFRFESARARQFARLGESESQLARRFGRITIRKPDEFVFLGRLQAIGERLSFTIGSLGLTATLIDDRCERIQYFRQGRWTEEQFSAILASNLDGLSWIPIHSAAPRLSRDWTREDGATATWRIASGFTISSSRYLASVDRIQRAAGVQDMAGSAS